METPKVSHEIECIPTLQLKLFITQLYLSQLIILDHFNNIGLHQNFFPKKVQLNIVSQCVGSDVGLRVWSLQKQKHFESCAILVASWIYCLRCTSPVLLVAYFPRYYDDIRTRKYDYLMGNQFVWSVNTIHHQNNKTRIFVYILSLSLALPFSLCQGWGTARNFLTAFSFLMKSTC